MTDIIHKRKKSPMETINKVVGGAQDATGAINSINNLIPDSPEVDLKALPAENNAADQGLMLAQKAMKRRYKNLGGA